MLRTSTLTAFLLVAVCTGLVLISPTTASAQNQSDVFWVAYYSGGAASAGVVPNPDGSIQVINPGASGGTLCADIYVFDQNEELQECCNCSVTTDGLLTESTFDLTNNPSFQGKFASTGAIKIVSDATCTATSPTPTAELRSYIINPQSVTVTESEFESAPLSASEITQLSNACGFIKNNQSGRGVCGRANPACSLN
jgi:hypothetical protein